MRPTLSPCRLRHAELPSERLLGSEDPRLRHLSRGRHQLGCQRSSNVSSATVTLRLGRRHHLRCSCVLLCKKTGTLPPAGDWNQVFVSIILGEDLRSLGHQKKAYDHEAPPARPEPYRFTPAARNEVL